MTENSNEKNTIIDPQTGKESEASQFKGDESLEKDVKNSKSTDGGDDPDVKFNTDTEYRNTTIDEAGQVSGPSAEGRRTRVDEISENPSEDSDK
jgi:hypothetical protein